MDRHKSKVEAILQKIHDEIVASKLVARVCVGMDETWSAQKSMCQIVPVNEVESDISFGTNTAWDVRFDSTVMLSFHGVSQEAIFKAQQIRERLIDLFHLSSAFADMETLGKKINVIKVEVTRGSTVYKTINRINMQVTAFVIHVYVRIPIHEYA